MNQKRPYWAAEARFDWDAYVQEQGGVRALHTKDRREYLMTCGKCQRDKLAVNTSKRAWRCFVCNTAGRDAVSLVVQAEDKLWHEAMSVVLSGHARVIGAIDQIAVALQDSRFERPRSWIPKERPWPDGWEWVWASTDGAKRGQDYCIQRGIADYVAQAMKLGVCTRGRFRGRLMFPVFDQAERLVFYQGRAMWTPRPFERHIKTLSPKLDEEHTFAGAADALLNLAWLQRRGNITRVAVVEGPVDCAHAWPDAVATFGKVIAPRQIELLMRAGIRELDLCFDSDAADAMMNQAPGLADLFVVRVVQFPGGTDPGDLSKEQIDYYRAQAVEWGTGARLHFLPHSLRPA